MSTLLSFFVILLAGLLFSKLFSRLHLPWVVALILGGIIIGPYGAGIFAPDPTIEFFSQVGLVFLMFMAGLEIRSSATKGLRSQVFGLAFINSMLPFLVGVGIAFYFGYEVVAALLLGVIFISSSIAVVIPTLAASNLSNTRIGRTIISTTMIEDVLSLILLSVLLQVTTPATGIPLLLFYPLVIVAFLVLRWAAPRVRYLFTEQNEEEHDMFERELRAVLVILIGTVVLFELLGLHAIIAGFFAGIVLADSITSKIFREKLHAISYGVFIPIFFVVVGTKTDISVFAELSGALGLAVAVVLGSILSKFISGWIGARSIKRSHPESMLVGAATIPQLSTTIAVAATGFEFGLIDQNLLSAMVVLSIVTTVVGPVLVRLVTRRHLREFALLSHEDVASQTTH